MSEERNLIRSFFKEHVTAVQTLLNENVEPNVTLKNGMAKIRELIVNWLSINRSDHSAKMLKLARDVQNVSELVEAKDV